MVSPLLKAQDTQPIFSSDVRVVNVFATVRSRAGRLIPDLTKDEFQLTEEGRKQTIRYFARETNLPLTLGLLIDTSGSQRRLLREESLASFQFLRQVVREDKDRAFVMSFEREAELLQDLTSSRGKLEASLNGIETPRPQTGGFPRQGGRRGGGGRGGTALNDAVLLASDELMRNQSGRKAIILLTDGVDNGSKVSLTRAIEAAQRADTIAYSVLFADEQAYGRQAPGPPRKGPVGQSAQQAVSGKRVLERLSRETGGGFFQVSPSLPLKQVFALIEEELRSQYSLGYSSDLPAASGSFRAIGLSVKRSDAVAQTRSGYYAIP